MLIRLHAGHPVRCDPFDSEVSRNWEIIHEKEIRCYFAIRHSHGRDHNIPFRWLGHVANSPGTFVPYNERHARRRKCGGYPWLALSAKDKTFMRKAAKG